MKVFQTPTVNLDYDQPKHRLIQKWNGFSTSEVFREAINKSVEFTKTNKVNSILSDTLEQSVVKPEDTQYAASVMPKLFMNGVKAMAFVMPKNILTQMSLSKFDKESKSDNIQFFSSVNEAQSWLDTIG
jgi:hypothetical protein